MSIGNNLLMVLWVKDRVNINGIPRLIIDRNGNVGIGKPEPLSGNLSGYRGRRIDEKNRIVYCIKDNEIQIIQLQRFLNPYQERER